MSLLRLFLLLLLLLSLSSSAFSQPPTNTSAASCPLDFTVLRLRSNRPSDLLATCQYVLQGLRLVESHHLQLTNSFLPPSDSAESCWSTYQSIINNFLPNFDVRSSCGFQTPWISQGCMNITTKSQFESLIPNSTLNDVLSNCNQSLESNSPCASCTRSLSSLQASYLTGNSVGNVSDCTAYPSIYAAAFSNLYGPTDPGTAKCLFQLDLVGSTPTGRTKKKIVLIVVVIAFGIGLIGIGGGFWVFWRKYKNLRQERMNIDKINVAEMGSGSGLGSISESTTLVEFTFDEIKKATRNFSRDNLIGKGGYGNVYKGLLRDGSEVAFKRFKNCLSGGDAEFAHEVEVIASVRHVNLVALKGYCTSTTRMEGHQRIIVCDIMTNGSLHDHLYGSTEKKLSWPIRQKIALGMARGLAYLHYGVQPGIIHRDIKASNILLDEKFEAKVADFGLAKFTPEGISHVTTRVAGTMGYVAPEYALYGQLTERSDVYSFGVVLLELLSGKKALTLDSDNQPSLVSDWAWSLVRQGRALEVIEDGMPELGSEELLEKYVLVAILCSHPQLYARPMMDQVVKMLETDHLVPKIPERPVSLIANMDEIERSISGGSNSSHHSSVAAGYQAFIHQGDRSSRRNEDTSS